MARDPLDIIEQAESGGRNVPNYKYGPGFTASGHYQMINATWRRWADAAGIDISKYPRAIDAPKEVQRAVAAQGFKMEGFRPWEATKHLVGQEKDYSIGAVPSAPKAASPGTTPMTMPAATSSAGLPPKPPGMTNSEYVRELQLSAAKIRNLPINADLRTILHTAGAKTGLIAEI